MCFAFFCRVKQLLKDQNSNEENIEPSQSPPTTVNEYKPLHSDANRMVSLEKYKLEVEQRVNNQ